jgi:hypothetical protein
VRSWRKERREVGEGPDRWVSPVSRKKGKRGECQGRLAVPDFPELAQLGHLKPFKKNCFLFYFMFSAKLFNK